MTADNGHREDDSAMSDHDRLIRIDTRVGKLDRCMSNHLAHHREERLAVRGALLAALLSLAIILLSAFLLSRAGLLNAAKLSEPVPAVRAYALEAELPEMDELHLRGGM